MKNAIRSLIYHATFLLAALAFMGIAYYAYHWVTGGLPGPWGDAAIWLCCMYIGLIYPIRKKQDTSSEHEP
jgi:hypothetical protein